MNCTHDSKLTMLSDLKLYKLYLEIYLQQIKDRALDWICHFNLKKELRKLKSYLINVAAISFCILMAFSAVVLGMINGKHLSDRLSQKPLMFKKPEIEITSSKESADQKTWTARKTFVNQKLSSSVQVSADQNASFDQKISPAKETSTDHKASTDQKISSDGKSPVDLQATAKRKVSSASKVLCDPKASTNLMATPDPKVSIDPKASSDPKASPELKACQENIVDDAKIQDLETVSDPSNILSNDFLSALYKGAFSDVSLRCGNDIISAHKFVLSARSPVFEAMFSALEYKIILIEDLDRTILKDLLSFIYGAQIQNLTLSKACDLMYAAKAYQIKGLKNICVSYLKSHLSVENALQILECADLYDKNLKLNTLNYICSNFFIIKEAKQWKLLQSEKPALAIEVYSMVVNAFMENKI